MDKKFVVRPKNPDKKDDKSITMTIRIDRELQKSMLILPKKATVLAMNWFLWRFDMH